MDRLLNLIDLAAGRARSAAKALAPVFTLVLALTALVPGSLAAQGLESSSAPGIGAVPDEDNAVFSPALWASAQRPRLAGGDRSGRSAADQPSVGGMSFAKAALADTSVRYNQVYMKSAHNAYERDEAVLDQLIYHRVRSLEFDIHNDKSWQDSVNQDWFVYHRDLVASDTTCNRLSDCLTELRAFHNANPYHEVVTVFLDLKDTWENGRNPSDLDARILMHLPSYSILKPADLMISCYGAWTLQSSVQGACGWPTLSSLRGKFIFVLTGGNVSSSGTPLNAYVSDGADARNRIAFVAPEITNANQIPEKDYVVFFNMEAGSMSLAGNVRFYNLVSRIYGLEDEASFNGGKYWGGNHLGTNLVNYHVDPALTTHSWRGWPFQCQPGYSCPDIAEDARILGVEVDSDDIWGSSDHFRFLYELNTSTSDAWWSTLVSTPNSHVEGWAKGCLMARATTASNSPYFAICRPADGNKLRVQWRTSAGGGTSYQDADITPSNTIDPESVSNIQLLVYNGGKCAAGYGSQDGLSWTLITYKCFSTTLPRQGVATSSHGNNTIKFLYTKLNKNGWGYYNATFPYALSIGTVRGYWAFDGPFH